jgi:type II secretory pathway pseudopilin PulG
VQVNISNNESRRQPLRRKLHSESGVTILEMVVAMLILTIGLLGLAASIGYAVTVSNKGRNLTNSKLLVVSLLEQMETLRNTEQLTFGQIANQGQVDDTGATRQFAGFPTAFLPLANDPGPDGILGTSDDDSASVVPGYQRQVLISLLNPNLKRVQVTVRYPDAGGQMHDLVGVSYLNNDTRSNFR